MGWLDKYQDGGEETYGTYSLPEVVVTPEPEELRDIVSYKDIKAGNKKSLSTDNKTRPTNKKANYSKNKTQLDILDDYVLDIGNQSLLDQIPYYPIVTALNSFLGQGRPLTAISDLLKQPVGVLGDIGINAIQENPLGYDVKSLEDKIMPAVRLAKNAFGSDAIISNIGRQILSSGETSNSKWSGREYNLPTLPDAAKLLNIDDNTFVSFVEDNWEKSGRNYKKLLDLAKVKFKNNKPLDKKANGGVITDPRGQWAHPGKVTRIPSNQITMDGVPYPVMGISDTGDTQMMYPGKDYSFDGTYVTEYPMMSEGGQKDKTIKCSNCGWSWKQSNAGSDPYTCHKCGGQNTGKLMMKNGGWLQKYQGDTDGSTVKEPSVKTIDLPEIVVSETPKRINQQREIIQRTKPKNNYTIVDKGQNLMYYFDPSGELISKENIITGASNNDLDVGKSMKQFFEENNTDSHEAYFEYLKKAKNQTTPSGIYNISGLRTDTAQNPDKIGALFNKIFRPEREQQIEEIRIKDYGQQQKLFTLQSEFGVPSSKAIHGTMREDRVAAFEDPSRDRNMSNGCINVNGKTMCFDTLEKGSGVYILPEESQELLYPNADAKKGRKTNSVYTKTRTAISDALFNRGIEPTKEALDFISAVAEKESRGGRSKIAALEKFLPRAIAESQGTLQINPDMDAFGKYIPSDFDGSLETSAEAVYNFYNQFKNLTPEQMYQEYTGGKDGKYDKAFKRVFDRMSNVYKSGGQHGGLDRWFAEKWVDVKTGKECGRQEGEDRDYPACRPSKRVSAATPKTASELSSAEKAKFKREKQSSKRIDYNHKKEDGGQIGWLDNYK